MLPSPQKDGWSAVVCVVRPPIEAIVLLPGLDSQHVGQQFEGGCRLNGNDGRRVYHECLHPVRDTCDLSFFGANHLATWEKGKPCGVGGCCVGNGRDIPCPTNTLSEAAAVGSGIPVREWSSHADQGMSEVGGNIADAVAGCCTLLEDGGCPLCITGRAGIVDGIAPCIGGPAA